MLVLKKIATLLVMPLTVCLQVLGFGVLLLWMRRRSGTARVMLTLGVLTLTALSFGAVADLAIKPLELWYPPLIDVGRQKDVKWVVVLGGGHTTHPEFPVNAQLENASLARLIEGIRIHRSMPGSKMLLSGGAVFDPIPEAGTMAAVARMLGVSSDDIVLETSGRDTGEQAVGAREILGPVPCILVTSAVHMPRAMFFFKLAGMRAIPAPVDYSHRITRQIAPSQFFPSAKELKKIESALHEYLGLVWAKMMTIMR